jgi:hypothetical protein
MPSTVSTLDELTPQDVHGHLRVGVADLAHDPLHVEVVGEQRGRGLSAPQRVGVVWGGGVTRAKVRSDVSPPRCLLTPPHRTAVLQEGGRPFSRVLGGEERTNDLVLSLPELLVCPVLAVDHHGLRCRESDNNKEVAKLDAGLSRANVLTDEQTRYTTTNDLIRSREQLAREAVDETELGF